MYCCWESTFLQACPLSAREIPGIAELGLSTSGKTFKLLAPDERNLWRLGRGLSDL